MALGSRLPRPPGAGRGFMLVLALDTTTRPGSLALMRGGVLIEQMTGDPAPTHAQRLPADIIELLGRHRQTVSAIDLYAVAAGPGSFTGLRIGIATIQGLALVNGRLVVPVSALEALAVAVPETALAAAGERVAPALVAVWMDARRGEVFSALYRARLGREAGMDERLAAFELLEGPLVETPGATLDRWRDRVGDQVVYFAGDGTLVYRDYLAGRLGMNAHLPDAVPPLAATIAAIATCRGESGALPPGAVSPVYVRRPDAELSRERTRAAAPGRA